MAKNLRQFLIRAALIVAAGSSLVSCVKANPNTLDPDNYSVQMEGVGEHGSIACINYSGDSSDLDGLKIEANIYQNGQILDSGVPLEMIEGNSCFEMIDAKYTVGEPVSLELKVNLSTVSKEKYNIGDYVQFPFLLWFYGESGLLQYAIPSQSHPLAYDFQPVSSEFPDGDGHPVYAPCDGNVIRSEIIPGTVDTHNMWIYCQDSGYVIQLGHMMNQKNVGDNFSSGDQLGYLHWETGIGYPHNHSQVRRVSEFPVDINLDLGSESIAQIVDMFYPSIQIGGFNSSIGGLWISDSLPDSVKKMIQDGRFIPTY